MDTPLPSVEPLVAPPDVSEGLMAVLEQTRLADRRVTVLDRFGFTHTGYIARGKASGHPVLLANKNSKRGAVVEWNMVIRVTCANKRDGGLLWDIEEPTLADLIRAVEGLHKVIDNLEHN